MEKELVAKLNDEHLATILLCIDANKSTLKVLKLTGCENIIGHGLEPLRASTSIRQIDLSLVGQFESPKERASVNISTDAVIPILQGIIDNGGNSLRDFTLPRKFDEGRFQTPSSAYNQFINDFEQYILRLSLPCQCPNHGTSCHQVIGPDYSICDKCGNMYSYSCDSYDEIVSIKWS